MTKRSRKRTVRNKRLRGQVWDVGCDPVRCVLCPGDAPRDTRCELLVTLLNNLPRAISFFNSLQILIYGNSYCPKTKNLRIELVGDSLASNV